jgi:hypothetical protein
MIRIPTGKWRTVIIILAGALLLTLVLEMGLSWRLAAIIQQSFLQEPVAGAEAKVKVYWLSIRDIVRGEINRIQINSRNCKLGKLRYQTLEIESQGISFDLPVLLKKKQLQITHIHRARIKAAITETAFQDYLTLAYPQLKPRFIITPAGIQLSGQASIFGNSLPVVLKGRLGLSGPQKIRFFPERLIIANRTAPSSFIQFINQQIPLEFNILNEWPIQITSIRLNPGILSLSLKEFPK